VAVFIYKNSPKNPVFRLEERGFWLFEVKFSIKRLMELLE